MRKILIAVSLGAVLFTMQSAFAEDPLPPPEYDDHPAVENNTGAMPTGSDAVANIQAETGGSAAGTEDGEITIYYDGTGIKVYSGLNKVEVIPTGSDGWIGSYLVETGNIKFTPAGRPQLDCEAQSGASGWYGPCKLPEIEES